MITAIEMFKKELAMELVGTRKLLALVPADKFTWKPHAKSMAMGDLAIHIADIPGWINLALTTDVLDFAVTPYQPKACENADDLVALLDEKAALAQEALENAKEEQMREKWTMQNGEMVFMTLERWETIRHSFDQLIHHRAQLGVYLRLLDIPIPGVYGPSADEHGKM